VVVRLNRVHVEVMLNQANRHHGLKGDVRSVLASVLLFYVLAASMAKVISNERGREGREEQLEEQRRCVHDYTNTKVT